MPVKVLTKLEVLRDELREQLLRDPRYLTLMSLERSIREITGVLESAGLLPDRYRPAPGIPGLDGSSAALGTEAHPEGATAAAPVQGANGSAAAEESTVAPTIIDHHAAAEDQPVSGITAAAGAAALAMAAVERVRPEERLVPQPANDSEDQAIAASLDRGPFAEDGPAVHLPGVSATAEEIETAPPPAGSAPEAPAAETISASIATAEIGPPPEGTSEAKVEAVAAPSSDLPASEPEHAGAAAEVSPSATEAESPPKPEESAEAAGPHAGLQPSELSAGTAGERAGSPAPEPASTPPSGGTADENRHTATVAEAVAEDALAALHAERPPQESAPASADGAVPVLEPAAARQPAAAGELAPPTEPVDHRHSPEAIDHQEPAEEKVRQAAGGPEPDEHRPEPAAPSADGIAALHEEDGPGDVPAEQAPNAVEHPGQEPTVAAAPEPLAASSQRDPIAAELREPPAAAVSEDAEALNAAAASAPPQAALPVAPPEEGATAAKLDESPAAVFEEAEALNAAATSAPSQTVPPVAPPEEGAIAEELREPPAAAVSEDAEAPSATPASAPPDAAAISASDLPAAALSGHADAAAAEPARPSESPVEASPSHVADFAPEHPASSPPSEPAEPPSAISPHVNGAGPASSEIPEATDGLAAGKAELEVHPPREEALEAAAKAPGPQEEEHDEAPPRSAGRDASGMPILL